MQVHIAKAMQCAFMLELALLREADIVNKFYRLWQFVEQVYLQLFYHFFHLLRLVHRHKRQVHTLCQPLFALYYFLYGQLLR